MKSNYPNSLTAALAASYLFAAGCGTGPEDLEAESEGPLYSLASAIRTQRDIPVCWTTTGDATEKAWVEEALRGQRSWAHAANINFVGWESCASNATGILLSAGSRMATRYLSDPTRPAEMTLDFTATPERTWNRCIFNNLDREHCIKASALHEFGHALGFAHEHLRPDTPATCTQPAGGKNGDSTFGAWDRDSIMNYCDPAAELSAMDRAGTDRLYGARNGDDHRLLDYNGDGRVDLLCHDTISGRLSMDYAGTDALFSGANWSRASNWCNDSDTRRVFTGDFNGDGRADLLCFDLDSGERFVDYASSSGQFTGTDWSNAAGWCSGADTQRILIGDFNGDGRDDLMCFDTHDGTKLVDYADTDGHFNGTNWSRRDDSSCSGADRRVFVGDVDGDGRDDLYCHDFESGVQLVDYASATGRFDGPDWLHDGSWCAGEEPHELLVDDFDGDGDDDLLCYNYRNGDLSIDFAAGAINSLLWGAGPFQDADWSRSSRWCTAGGARLYAGDVNGDGRSDLICHYVHGGAKAIDYADTSGRFGNGDWLNLVSACGGDADELH